ncbi:hypothetical protein DERP_004938 [Dermatophagoides pteronyssinus]|uniref:Uncharacterized protein n=1 Tax=Dermatophagoides pteronyssinus TaxID=6956 RepID=A0ABQ8JSZ0_DERPT|nr:hypothetical protein DERP_004938 [Dermatophagoides pteronyssinus]
MTPIHVQIRSAMLLLLSSTVADADYANVMFFLLSKKKQIGNALAIEEFIDKDAADDCRLLCDNICGDGCNEPVPLPTPVPPYRP